MELGANEMPLFKGMGDTPIAYNASLNMVCLPIYADLTDEEVQMNVAYRWFLGYTLQEATPHFSTVSYNFRQRFTVETVDRIFGWILEEIAEAGYLSPDI